MPATDVPDAILGPPGGFIAACRPQHLVLFTLNVGDGDSHVLLLPEIGGRRRAVVVDVADEDKIRRFLAHLSTTPLLPPGDEPIVLVVATHPHDDHIRGMAGFLRDHADAIAEFWEPGYYQPSDAFIEMMAAIEDVHVRHLQPASGTVRWLGPVKLTVLAPAVALKSRYDSYGIDPNNSSIVLKLDYPAARVIQRAADRTYVRPPSQTVILGADAQTLSWAHVLDDFPQLGPDSTAVTDALRMANGVEPLSAQLFKVPHHGSKNGLNFELVTTVAPAVSVFSCGRQGGKYGFPHSVTQELVREGLEPIATKPQTPRSPDEKLGIAYTGSLTDGGNPGGSIAVLIPPSGRREVWRFMDGRTASVDLARGRKVTLP
jgi:beta-lactamase superfamily II metal-dependent hydrolase